MGRISAGPDPRLIHVFVSPRRVSSPPKGGHMYIGAGTLVIILVIIILILIF
jgi:hypothetical protein